MIRADQCRVKTNYQGQILFTIDSTHYELTFDIDPFGVTDSFEAHVRIGHAVNIRGFGRNRDKVPDQLQAVVDDIASLGELDLELGPYDTKLHELYVRKAMEYIMEKYHVETGTGSAIPQ